MKVAVVYNRESQRVINLFGMPNREKYGLKAIKRISDSLRAGGHQVETFEGDKDLIDNLEEFMPRVVKHERPGMVFNLSYGIQGQARYTHVPGILEMIGLPYVGSGPLAHSLALDKVVSKMIFVQHGVPTPEFAVLDAPGFEMPDLKFPLIVKPKNEAVSFGIKVVRSEKELREAADVIFEQFQQPVLTERYIPGREINVGLLGNHPGEALPPAEVDFGKTGPKIYTNEDKSRKSGREIKVICPAKLPPDVAARAQEIALQAFKVLGCADCARVDLRLDSQKNLYVLEVNSLPSLGEHGSYVQGAAAVGLDFTGLVNRLVEVASARYFGTPTPPDVTKRTIPATDKLGTFVSQHRDEIEKQVQTWTRTRSRTSDPVGIKTATEIYGTQLQEAGMKPVPALSDSRVAWTWESPAGMKDGTLLIAHCDVPLESSGTAPGFRRDPELLYGEGIGCSRAPMVSLLYALKALKHVRQLRKVPVGVLLYADEGRDCRYSEKMITEAANEVKNVLVLRPGNEGDYMVTSRRGQRMYQLTVEGDPLRLGKLTKKVEVLSWVMQTLPKISALTSKKDKIAVSAIDVKTSHLPMLLPHRVTVDLILSYPEEKIGDELEAKIREILETRGVQWQLELISSRPPMRERRASTRLAKAMETAAQEWDIPLKREASLWPSVAGLIPASKGVVCGIGPIARNVYTPDECTQRISLIQRTLLIAQYLMGTVPKS